MSTNIALPRAAGVWFAVVAALGLGFLTLAIPAAAQVRVGGRDPGTAHPWSTVQSAHPVIPDRDRDAPVWPGRQALPVAQPCGANALFADPFAPYSPWAQSQASAWPSGPTQYLMGGQDVMSWFGYNGGFMGWSNPYFNQNVAPGPCGGFQVMMP